MTGAEIECFAWAFWLDEIGHFLGPSNGLTANRVDQTIKHLQTMDTNGYALMAKKTPTEMHAFSERALPIYVESANALGRRSHSLRQLITAFAHQT